MGALVRLKSGLSIREFKGRLAELPLSVAHEIAQQAAPLLTSLAQEAYDAGRNVYGDVRKKGIDGQDLTLVDTGATRRTVVFVANGRIIRAHLGPKYAKYLIGKYKILPIGDRTKMPANWSRALEELGRTIIERPSRLAA